jgi:hypothetical protein
MVDAVVAEDVSSERRIHPTPNVIVNTRRILDLVRLDNDDRSLWTSLTVPLLLLNHSEWENDSDDRDSRMARHQL